MLEVGEDPNESTKEDEEEEEEPMLPKRKHKPQHKKKGVNMNDLSCPYCGGGVYKIRGEEGIFYCDSCNMFLEWED